MKDKKFSYNNSKHDASPRVLITTENQHIIRGFNLHYLSPEQIGEVRKQWRMVRNQHWSMATKERVIMRRAGKAVADSFRLYRKSNITKWYND
jgi:hypothetical protein